MSIMRRFMEGPSFLSSSPEDGPVRRAVSSGGGLCSRPSVLPVWEPRRPRPRAAGPPSLAVVISVDGLSWDRLQYYRPWYVSGLKRLLDESRLETETRYRHLNTETGPGHSSLSTGAPPRVSGVVAQPLVRAAARRLDPAGPELRGAARPARAAREHHRCSIARSRRTDRIYVFAQAATLEDWGISGEVGRGLTRLAYGPKGETVVFDSDDALVLFNMRHGRPYEAPPPTTRMVPGPGALRVPTLGDVLAERRPGARVVSLSAKDRSAIFMAGRRETHAAYWYDQDNGRFVTSPFYVPPAPAQGRGGRLEPPAGGPLLPARFGLAWKKLAASEPAIRAAPAPARARRWTCWTTSFRPTAWAGTIRSP